MRVWQCTADGGFTVRIHHVHSRMHMPVKDMLCAVGITMDTVAQDSHAGQGFTVHSWDPQCAAG